MVRSGVSSALPRHAGVQPVLVDYAYGGSQIDDSLTNGGSPATRGQVVQYLHDLGSGDVGASWEGQILHYINSGINPCTQIWTDALSAGSIYAAVNRAKYLISANVNALAAQMRSIHNSPAVASKLKAVDFLIVGIPPLEIVPTFSYQVNGNATKLRLLKSLVAQFNSELRTFASAFKNGTGRRVIFFDLAKLWYSLQSDPTYYGINVSPVNTTCYDSSTGSVCPNPSSYLYFDSLHPVTSVHQLVAKKLNAAVKNA